jgi:hypothetical protein
LEEWIEREWKKELEGTNKNIDEWMGNDREKGKEDREGKRKKSREGGRNREKE